MGSQLKQSRDLENRTVGKDCISSGCQPYSYSEFTQLGDNSSMTQRNAKETRVVSGCSA